MAQRAAHNEFHLNTQQLQWQKVRAIGSRKSEWLRSASWISVHLLDCNFRVKGGMKGTDNEFLKATWRDQNYELPVDKSCILPAGPQRESNNLNSRAYG